MPDIVIATEDAQPDSPEVRLARMEAELGLILAELRELRPILEKVAALAEVANALRDSPLASIFPSGLFGDGG